MQTDIRIPTPAAILDAARDVRDAAERIGDAAAIRQIDRLIVAVVRGASFAWQLGVLVVASPSGSTYHVRRSGCDCENGRHGRARCWHWAARNLLEDMRETEDQDADDQAIDAPPPPAAAAAHSLGARLAAARSVYQ